MRGGADSTAEGKHHPAHLYHLIDYLLRETLEPRNEDTADCLLFKECTFPVHVCGLDKELCGLREGGVTMGGVGCSVSFAWSNSCSML